MSVSVFPGTGKANVFPVPAGGVGLATVTGTTGSPSVDTTTRAGKTIYRFTGSGSITVGTAGTAVRLEMVAAARVVSSMMHSAICLLEH